MTETCVLFYLGTMGAIRRFFNNLFGIRSICYDCENCSKYLKYKDLLYTEEIIICEMGMNRLPYKTSKIRCCNNYFPRGKNKTLFPKEEVNPKEEHMT